MGFQSIAPLTTRGLSVAGWCLPPLVTYERMFRNRVHVTRCTRRAVTLFRLEEPPPGPARRHGGYRHGQGRELLSPPQSPPQLPGQHSSVCSTAPAHQLHS